MLYSIFYYSNYVMNKNKVYIMENNNTTKFPDFPIIIPEIPEKEINPEEEFPNKIFPDENIDPKNIPEIELPKEDVLPKIVDNNKKMIH